MGGMTKAQANRHSKTKNARSARRAAGVVDRNHRLNAEKEAKKILFFANRSMTVPHGTARKIRRAGLQGNDHHEWCLY